MKIKASKVLDYLDDNNFKYKFVGNLEMNITTFSSLGSLKSNCISWAKNQSNYNDGITKEYEDVLLIVNSGISYKEENKKMGYIECENPRDIFFSILNEFFYKKSFKSYISPKSAVDCKEIGEDVYIGHNCYISEDVVIGDNVVIMNNISIEGKTKIGENTIIHSGTIIGSDGFGYYKNNKGINTKIQHYGGVVIGNNVEIGANVCIDRGTLDDTVIGNNVKIDNLCHIAHNCIIKDNSIIIALSMLGGSAILEKNSYIAPGAMIKNQIHIGENSLVGMGAVVIKDVEDNKVVAGVPAKVIRDNL